MPTPLHQLAREARDRLASRAEDAEAPEGLVDLVREKGRVSVNMKPKALLSFLETGRRYNVFEWAERKAVMTGQSVDEVLREKLGFWYQRRMRFEKRAGDGRHFHYGALNVGGMGAPRYGRFCVIDGRRPTPGDTDPVWLAEDSLNGQRFRDSTGRLLWRRLKEWVAPPDMAAQLAGVKFSGRAVSGRMEERLCSEADYIEALSVNPPETEHVEEIRSETDDELQERAVEAVLSPTTAEHVDLEQHVEIRRHAERLGIQWTEVAS